MPIIVKDYTFLQTYSTATIRVPLHGIHKSKVDLLTAENYLKASFEQFFFEVFLFQPIDVSKSKCTLNEHEIIFELCKKDEVQWYAMEKNLDKVQKRVVRSKAFDEVQERTKKEHEDKLNKKELLKKCAVTEAIKIDTKQRNTIEAIKKEEKEKALGDIHEWNEGLRKKGRKNRFNIRQNCNDKEFLENTGRLMICDSAQKDKLSIKRDDNVENTIVNNRNSSESRKKNINIAKTKYYKNIKNTPTNENVSIPLPRNGAVIDVDFTERVLPTPSRESKKAEEDEWLTKQAEARRSVGFVSGDLRAEEKNPQCLLAKGNRFLKNGNYLGAISAYSFGIQISPKYVDLYIKRSEAQYLLGNYHKTANDCSSAIDMMKPEVSANLEQRAICIGRRGMALHQMGMKRQALDELKASLCLNSSNAEFGQYYYKVLDELNSGNCEEQDKDDSKNPGFDLFK